MASCFRDFPRMTPQIFFRSNMYEDPQDLLDDISRFFYVMGFISNENKLAAYQLKDVAHT